MLVVCLIFDSKKIGIEKSIGIGIENIWYRKKDSDSVSFRFWVSSHTGPEGLQLEVRARRAPRLLVYIQYTYNDEKHDDCDDYDT